VVTRTAIKVRLTWRAGEDLIGHAHRNNQPRTLCDRSVVLERLAWPAQRRCLICEQRAEEVATA
jgi:hypothetical protein